MAKPEERGGSGGGGGCRLSLVSLGAALVAAAAVALCVMCLDARRQDQLSELRDQLAELRQLVDTMRSQLDRHEEKLNATLHAKHTVSSEPAEEVVYEDEYEYDDEEGSYEYDDEEEPNAKATVKRTAILGDSAPSRNSTDPVGPTKPQKYSHTHKATPRTRRDVRAQALPVREESITGPMSGPAHEAKSSHQLTAQQSPVYQEQRRPEESVVRLRHRGRNRNGNMDNVELINQNSGEEFIPPDKSTEQHVKLLAAHFVGDASIYNTRDHSHYYGNNILYHPHGLFKDWLPSSWMFDLGTYTDFPMLNGKLSIQKPGVYFVYAQVYYAATHDRCGFHIKHNGEEVAQCTTMTTGRMVKRNTCFTAVILHLFKSDQLWVSEVEGHRNTSFKSSHSFFGLIQLKPT